MRTKRTEYKHVLLWPDGTPTVSGTRLTVKHVAAQHRYNGKGPEELVDAFPPHTLGEMYSALAYYYDHKADMDQQMDKDEHDFEEARTAAAETSPVHKKLRSLDRVL
jgi:uncharacterized protein (DUF433 family)